MRILIHASALPAFFLAASIATHSQSPPQPSRNFPDAIHPGDLIDVDVAGSLEFDWRGKLTAEGFLDNFDKVGEQIYGLCRTERQLAEAISRQYSRFLRDPQVTVRVLDRSGRPETILTGAVKSPHRFRLRREARLAELIVLAGGITDLAGGQITVFRPAGLTCEADGDDSESVSIRPNSSPRTLNITIAELLEGKPDANPVLYHGDMVNVVPAWPVFVIGGVGAPQRVPLRSELTVSRAVASAGGVAKDGIAENVTIFRRSDGKTEILETDLTRIGSGSLDDVVLRPYDIVEVGQKGRGKRQFPPVVETDPPAVTGASLPLRIIE